MTEVELMQSIKEKHGAAIDAVCAGSSVPPAFIAALIANESGGNENAKRFEPGVLSALWQVLVGRKAAYGSIGAADLIQFITADASATLRAAQSLPADAFQRLDSLAVSWGVTQIMGYEILSALPLKLTGNSGLAALRTDVPYQLRMTIFLLADFAKRWGLDLATDADRLLDCWNTGRPHKDGAPNVPQPTADPQYIPNGLARMKIYAGL